MNFNRSQKLHIAAFFGVTLLFMMEIEWYKIVAVLAVGLEVDQAMTYMPKRPWLWFTKKDTLMDLIADMLGIGLCFVIFRGIQLCL
jgi:hypothetical protein